MYNGIKITTLYSIGSNCLLYTVYFCSYFSVLFGSLCLVVEYCWKLLFIFLLEEMVIWSFDCFGISLKSSVVPALVVLSVFDVSFRIYWILTAIADTRIPKEWHSLLVSLCNCSQNNCAKIIQVMLHYDKLIWLLNTHRTTTLALE